MAILLPSKPGPGPFEPQYRDFGGVMQGALGGAAQRNNRLGNRWRIDVTMPAMQPIEAAEWSVMLPRAVRLGARYPIRQPGLALGSPGAVRVAGAGQAGDSLTLDGFTVGHAIRAGQWVSLVTNGQRYLYKFAENARIGVGGMAKLAIEPLLRVIPQDNDIAEITQPYIEGNLTFEGGSFDTDALTRGFKFTIDEAR
ncbi:hypothetical protein D6851_02600 [Altericroceibacterium spongiae]|uniref:Uncharacterized protein n=1 Tax=Altericroceibacterium spongiae TaxID=2320269 RepID=A0A420ERX0_9SPHN|nr:hypothetical protein [Altericroceibacterium spongiae]RKF23380.1 hypothetical protein D6851_02600 [Altericroceibacterium spongiae]